MNLGLLIKFHFCSF